MTAYQVATKGYEPTLIPGDGDLNTVFIPAEQAVNPITGNIGITTFRITNTSATNVATVYWTPTSTTYTFNDVAYTTDSADGTGAIVNATATQAGYVIQVAFGGNDYLVGDTISVLGTAVGGSTTANDLVITVDAVAANTGAITAVSVAGTALWPQSTDGQATILPLSENFIQVATAGACGCNVSGQGVDGAMEFLPVTIVG